MSTTLPYLTRTLTCVSALLTTAALLTACGDDNSDATRNTAADGTAATTPGAGAPGSDGTTSSTSQPSGASASSSSALDSRCHTSELTITIGAGQGAAGSVYHPLEFTNASDRDCTVSGYPGVSLVADAAGTQQVGAPAERDGESSGADNAQLITLAPGQSASTDLKITNPGVFGDQCIETPASALKIFPPDERDATVVPAEGLIGCSGDGAPVTLRTSPLRAEDNPAT